MEVRVGASGPEYRRILQTLTQFVSSAYEVILLAQRMSELHARLNEQKDRYSSLVGDLDALMPEQPPVQT